MQQYQYSDLFRIFTDAIEANPVESILLNAQLLQKFHPARSNDEEAAKMVWDYFEKKVIPHKIAVGVAFVEIRDKLREFGIDVGRLAELITYHDLSKFSEEEAWGYAKYKFGQPNTKEAENAFDRAWHHHKMNNPHHPEYWLNPGKDGSCKPLEIPDIYLAEMICDWIGAGKSYGNPFESWAQKYLHEFTFNPKTASRLMDMLETVFPNMMFEINVTPDYGYSIVAGTLHI